MSHPPSSYGIWFYCDCAPPTVSLWLLLCLCMWGIFFGKFQCLPVDDCSAVSCDSGALARGSESTSFYSAILNQSPQVLFVLLFLILLGGRLGCLFEIFLVFWGRPVSLWTFLRNCFCCIPKILYDCVFIVICLKVFFNFVFHFVIDSLVFVFGIF